MRHKPVQCPRGLRGNVRRRVAQQPGAVLVHVLRGIRRGQYCGQQARMHRCVGRLAVSLVCIRSLMNLRDYCVCAALQHTMHVPRGGRLRARRTETEAPAARATSFQTQASTAIAQLPALTRWLTELETTSAIGCRAASVSAFGASIDQTSRPFFPCAWLMWRVFARRSTRRGLRRGVGQLCRLRSRSRLLLRGLCSANDLAAVPCDTRGGRSG